MCLFHFHMAIRQLWPQSRLLNLTWLDLRANGVFHEEVVSHPEYAWKWALLGTCALQGCTDSINVIKSEVFPMPKATHISARGWIASRSWNWPARITMTSVSTVRIEQSSTPAEVHGLHELQLRCLLLHDCSCSSGCCNQMRTLLVLTSHTRLCQIARWTP